jgi:hypothetical protein
MRRWIATALMLAALPAHAQLITHRDLSYPMALSMATGALDVCKGRGYAVAVGVAPARTRWKTRAARPTPRAPSA